MLLLGTGFCRPIAQLVFLDKSGISDSQMCTHEPCRPEVLRRDFFPEDGKLI